MKRLIRAEFLKLRSTRAVPGSLLAMVAAATGWAAYTILWAGHHGAPSLGTTGSMRALVTIPGLAAIPLLLLGVAAVTGEFRHQTASAMFLVEPRRDRVVAAKLAAVAAVGFGYGVTALAAVLAVALPWLLARGVPVDLANRGLQLATLGALLRLPAYGLLGVAVGALLRHQVAAAVVPLVWLYIAEGYVDDLRPGAFRWLLSGADAALGRAEIGGLLPQWTGALLLGGYVLALGALGAALVNRRDLT
jgi:hypothetical protein